MSPNYLPEDAREDGDAGLQREDIEPIAVADGRSKVEIIESLDEDDAVGHGYMDLFEDDWHESFVSLEKLQMAIDAATSEYGTHIRFYVNENGVVIFQKAHHEGIVVMPMGNPNNRVIK